MTMTLIVCISVFQSAGYNPLEDCETLQRMSERIELNTKMYGNSSVLFVGRKDRYFYTAFLKYKNYVFVQCYICTPIYGYICMLIHRFTM